MEKRYEVVVIGGGQAGLSMGYHLGLRGRSFAILDAAPAVGHAWRARWDSLKLFTPAGFSSLPGLPFPGDPERCPGKDEVADYLSMYARIFDLPVRSEEPVLALRPLPGGAGFEVETRSALYLAEQVVVATGPFQHPRVPPHAIGLDPGVVQLHSSEYRNPDQLPPGDILVVGGGNSGVQIAAELATARRTSLALGKKMACLPERFLGRSLFWYLEKSGVMRVTVDSRLGQKARRRDLLIGQGPDALARRLGVRLMGRVVGAEGDRIHFRDGGTLRVSGVVWATGFRSDYRWVHAPVFDDRGLPVHQRGITALPGLHFLGLPWQHTRGSALIGWVGRDAEFLAGRTRTGADRGPAGSAGPAPALASYLRRSASETARSARGAITL